MGENAFNTTAIKAMNALPNIISLYPPFLVDFQFVLTQLLPLVSAGIIKSEPNNSAGWINILKIIRAQVQKKPHTQPAKLPLTMCCKNPPHIVAIKETIHPHINIKINMTGKNNVIMNFITHDISSPISVFIRFAKNKNIP